MKSGSTENVARLDSLNIVRMWPIAMLAWLLLVGAGESELVEARREAEEAGRDWNQASRAFDELSALRSARALAADEVARGELRDQFVVDAYQSGADGKRDADRAHLDIGAGGGVDDERAGGGSD